MDSSLSPAIGIDIGLDSCKLAVFINGKPEIILNESKEKYFPFSILFSDKAKGNVEIGKKIKNTISENKIFAVKRLLGRNFKDKDIQKYTDYLPFLTFKDENSNRARFSVTINNQEWKLLIEEIYIYMLRYLRDVAENYLKKEVKDVVISVPNYFNTLQRYIVMDSCQIAGLNVLHLISDGSSAALYYRIISPPEVKKVFMIYDLGAGSISATLAIMLPNTLDIKSHCGDPNLGGIDFENNLIKFCMEDFKSKTGIKLNGDCKALTKLRKACENAKKILSTSKEAIIDIENLKDEKDYEVEITREQFEEMNKELFERCKIPINDILFSTGATNQMIQEVLLLGEASKMPKIKQIILETLGNHINIVDKTDEEYISVGAAIRGAVLQKIDNPSIQNICFMDVTPFPLGAEIGQGIMNVWIQKNCPIPTISTQCKTTVFDNQDNILVSIYEGNKESTKDNQFIDKFTIYGIPPLPKGIPQVYVTFNLDANGILSVSAQEKLMQKEYKIIAQNNNQRLSSDYINKLMERFKEEKKFLDLNININIKMNIKVNEKSTIEDIKNQILKLKPQFKDRLGDFTFEGQEIPDKIQFIKSLNVQENNVINVELNDDLKNDIKKIKVFVQIMDNPIRIPIDVNLNDSFEEVDKVVLSAANYLTGTSYYYICNARILKNKKTNKENGLFDKGVISCIRMPTNNSS